MFVCVCLLDMTAVQPQHPDEVSLIGSLWDSSAAFHRAPAHCQQSALTGPKTKDGTCYSPSSSFAPTPSSHTRTQAYIQYTHTRTNNHQSSKCICQLLVECWDESGSHNYCGLPKCLHPRLPSRIIGCIFLPAFPQTCAAVVVFFLSPTQNMETDSYLTS